MSFFSLWDPYASSILCFCFFLIIVIVATIVITTTIIITTILIILIRARRNGVHFELLAAVAAWCSHGGVHSKGELRIKIN
jgi:hypothetical protein